MKQIFPLFFLILTISLFGQEESNFKVSNLIQANTNNGGGISHVAFDNSGNTITVGRASGNFIFEQQSIFPTGLIDLFIYKSKTSTKEKVFLSTLNAGSKGKMWPYKIYVDQYDDVFIIFYFLGTVKINDSSFESNSGVGDNFFLAKISSEGDILWGTKLENTINIVSTDDFTFMHSNAKINKYDRHSGELIKTTDAELHYFSSIKTYNNKLYVSGLVLKNFEFNGLNVNSNDYLLAELDVDLNITNLLKSNSFNEFVIHDNNIIFKQNISSSNIQTIPIVSSSGINSTIVAPSNWQSRFALGKVDIDFKTLKWHNMNYYSPLSGIELLPGVNGNINLYHSQLSSITINGSTYNSNSNETIVELNKDGQYINHYNFSGTHSWEGWGIQGENNLIAMILPTINSNNNYYTSNISVLNKKASDNNFTLLNTYTSTGDSGGIRNSGIIIKSNDESIYNDVGLLGSIPAYLGNNYFFAKRTNLFSKSSKDGLSLWNIGITDADETGSASVFQLRRYGKRIDQNLQEESIYSSVCFDTSNYIPKGCTLSGTNINSTQIKNSVLLAKLDSQGYEKWQKRFVSQSDSHSSRMDITNIKFDKQDNVWITARGYGNFIYNNTNNITLSSSFLQNDFFIIKLDSNGNLLFLKKYNYNTYNNVYFDFDKDNNPIFIFNIKAYDIKFDSFQIPKNGEADQQTIFIKMNTNGEIILVKNLTPIENHFNAYPHYILDIKKSNEEFFVYAISNTNNTLENIRFTNPYSTQYTRYSFIISKITSDGDVKWSNPIIKNNEKYASDFRGDFLSTDSESNLYLSLSSSDKMLYKGTELQLDKDFLENVIIKFDKDGNYKNHKRLGTHLSDFNIHINSKDEITLSGSSYQNSIDEQIINNTGGDNYLIFSLEKDILNTSETLKENIKLFPNPASDFININTKEKINNIEIYDSTGRKVTVEFNLNNQIDVSKLINGIYYIRITTAKNSLTSKFIKK